MKTAEDWKDSYFEQVFNRPIEKFIQSIQKESWNEALKAAAKAAEVKDVPACQFTDFCGTTEIKDYVVDKNSILKLKIK